MRSDKVALLLIMVLCALAARWLLSPTRANLPAPLATVHLLPLVGPTRPDLTEVQRTLEAFTGVQARLEKPVPLPASALQQGMPLTKHTALCTDVECFKKHSYQRISH